MNFRVFKIKIKTIKSSIAQQLYFNVKTLNI